MRPTLIACLAVAAASPGLAAEPLRVDLSADGYTFEGWGTSLGWWADRVGDWPDDALDALVHAITDPDAGLGLSVFRYNLGGGDDPDHDHFRAGGAVPGFQAGPDEPIDPNADPRQRRVLLKLIARVEDPVLEAWSNSPPYWMTHSGCAGGGVEGRANLPDERIEDFAAYLAEVLLVYRERHGVVFQTLDPFNEPNSWWWKAGGNQEGCRIPERQQGPLIHATADALDERGFTGVTAVAATDGHSIDVTLQNVRRLDAEALARVGQINTHTYAGDKRRALRQFAAKHGKRLWQSETGPMALEAEEGAEGIAMMARVALDLNELRAAAWLMWQVSDDSPAWSCLQTDGEAHAFQPNANFHLYRQFTRAIRPGTTIVPTADPRVVVAVSPDEQRVAVVVVNDQDAARRRSITFEGSEAPTALLSSTAVDGRGDLSNLPNVGVAEGVLTIESPPLSVATIVLEPTR